MQNPVTGKSHGWGFILYKTDAAAQHALGAGKFHNIRGVRVEIRMADSGAAAANENRKIFVGGLHPDTREKELWQYFEQFGEVVASKIPQDETTGNSRGFGFVTFEAEDAVRKVFAKGLYHEIHGWLAEVKKATPRQENTPEETQPATQAVASEETGHPTPVQYAPHPAAAHYGQVQHAPHPAQAHYGQVQYAPHPAQAQGQYVQYAPQPAQYAPHPAQAQPQYAQYAPQPGPMQYAPHPGQAQYVQAQYAQYPGGSYVQYAPQPAQVQYAPHPMQPAMQEGLPATLDDFHHQEAATDSSTASALQQQVSALQKQLDEMKGRLEMAQEAPPPAANVWAPPMAQPPAAQMAGTWGQPPPAPPPAQEGPPRGVSTEAPETVSSRADSDESALTAQFSRNDSMDEYGQHLIQALNLNGSPAASRAAVDAGTSSSEAFGAAFEPSGPAENGGPPAKPAASLAANIKSLPNSFSLVQKLDQLQAAFPSMPEDELLGSLAACGGSVEAAHADVLQLQNAKAASSVDGLDALAAEEKAALLEMATIIDGLDGLAPEEKATLLGMTPADRQAALSVMGYDVDFPEMPAEDAETVAAPDPAPAPCVPEVKRSLGERKPPRRRGSRNAAQPGTSPAARRAFSQHDYGGFKAEAARVRAQGRSNADLAEDSAQLHLQADGLAKAAAAFFNHAGTAFYARGGGAGAKDSSGKGQEYLRRSKADRRLAGVLAFVAHNPAGAFPDEVDLHGLAVEEALEACMYALGETRSTKVRIITGQGNHSVDNVARLGPEVKAFLTERKIRYKDEGAAAVLAFPPS